MRQKSKFNFKMMLKKKIKIAGAGISGLTAALNLAKAGYDVEVFERASETESRFSGDMQGIENWVLKQDILDFLREANIKINFKYKRVNQISVWGPSGIKKNIQFSRPIYYLVRRGLKEGYLDYGLREQAKMMKNIKIFYNHPLEPREADIVATGPVFNDPHIDGLASGYVFDTDLNDLSVVIVSDKYALDGYAYFFVWDRYGVINCVIGGNYKKLKRYREKTLNLCKKYKKFKMENIKPFVGVGNFFLPKIPKDKKIYIGEAGGFQDLLFGFGMRYALLTGYYAAQSIIGNQDFYEICEKEIFPKMRVSIVNRLLYKPLGRRSYEWFIKKLAESSDPLGFLRKQYNFSLTKKILFPIAKIILSKNIKDPRINI